MKTACTPAPCTHNISTFPFPLQIPSFPLTCSLDKEAITDSQETREIGNLTDQLATDLWQERRLNKRIHGPLVQSETETQLS